jgi:hypothetical protein
MSVDVVRQHRERSTSGGRTYAPAPESERRRQRAAPPPM